MRTSSRWWWGASLLVHGALFAGASSRVARADEPAPAPKRESLVEFELPHVGAPPRETPTIADDTRPAAQTASPQANAPDVVPEPTQGGRPRSAQNIRADQSGARGDGRSLEHGALLASLADAVNLSAYVMNTLGIDQEARVRNSAVSRSFQQRTSMPDPGLDATRGTAEHALELQITRARTNAAQGSVLARGAPQIEAREVPRVNVNPEALGPAPRTPRTASAARVGGGLAAPNANGSPAPESRVARSVPAIQLGRASNTAPLAATDNRDDANAVLLAALMLQQSQNASVQDGPRHGAGVGGVGGGGPAGSGGGVTQGGRASASNGVLSGDGLATNARYQRYLLTVRSRIDALWTEAFPREEMLQFRQGRVIVSFVIESDGTVSASRFSRRGDIDVFARNVLTAVKTVRLPPIPAELQRNQLSIDMTFRFNNAMVR